VTLRPVVFAAAFGITFVGIGLWFAAGRNPEPDRRIISIAVSSNGRWIAAGTRAGSITVFDRDFPGRSRRIQAGSSELNDLQFSPDERLLAIANRGLSVHSVETQSQARILRSDDRNYGTARFSSDGRRLLTITGAATVEVLDPNSGALQLTICCSTIYGETTFSPDGTMIVTAGHWPAFWDTRSGKLLRRLTGDREFQTFRPIAFDPMRSWVLMGSQDGRVYCWEVSTGRRTATSRGHSGYVDSIAVPKDSPWIAYSAFGGAVRLWNPDSQVERLLGPTTASNLVAGKQPHSILLGTQTGFVEIWDTDKQQISQQYDLR
jgi:WD40 repeat protein